MALLQCFRKGAALALRNALSFVMLGVMSTVALIAVEWSLFYVFGHVTGENSWFLKPLVEDEADLTLFRAVHLAPPLGRQGEQLDASILAHHHWKWLAFAALLASRVLLFYPLVAGWYAAIFNALRRQSELIFLSDVLLCFESSLLPRVVWLGAACFTANLFFFHVLLELLGPGAAVMPFLLYTLFAFLTVFSFPLCVEQEDVSVVDCLRISARCWLDHPLGLSTFVVATYALNIAGAAFYGMGLLLALPITMCATCVCYHRLIGVRELSHLDALV